jgi:hypothetical protein
MFCRITKISLFLQKTYFFENQIISNYAPFTQLNTPSATAYIKGFLNTKDIDSVQADLGLK